MKQQRRTLKSQLSNPEHEEDSKAANGGADDVNSTEVRPRTYDMIVWLTRRYSLG